LETLLYLVIGLIPGALFLASLISTSRWQLSTARSLTIVALSLIAAALGFVYGGKAFMSMDKSGDASALTAAFFVSAFVFAPLAGLIFYWAAIAFSVSFKRPR